jgi:hypothetical protein
LSLAADLHFGAALMKSSFGISGTNDATAAIESGGEGGERDPGILQVILGYSARYHEATVHVSVVNRIVGLHGNYLSTLDRKQQMAGKLPSKEEGSSSCGHRYGPARRRHALLAEVYICFREQ